MRCSEPPIALWLRLIGPWAYIIYEALMKKIAICLFSVIWLLLAATVVLGCTCQRSVLENVKSEKDQVIEARKFAEVVFSGIVTEVIVDEQAHTFEARLKVRESWKGVEAVTVSLFGGTECCFCEY